MVAATKTTPRKTIAEKKAIAAAVAEKLAPTPLGELIDGMYKLREEKRELDAKVKKLEDQITVAQDALLERLEEQKVDGSRGKLASASISTTVVGNVEDWSAFEKFVLKTKALHLFQRRISEASYRELLENGKQVPGVTPFTKKRINLRVI